MKKYLAPLLFIVAFAFAGAANAGNLSSDAANQAGFNKLTTEQQAKILADISATAGTNTGESKTAVSQVSEWAELGSKLGAGLANTAKELGVAANEFVNTPVGKITMAIIVWKFMGAALVHIVGGVAFFVVALGCLFTIMGKMSRETKVEYSDPTPGLFGLKTRNVKTMSSGFKGNWDTSDSVVCYFIAFTVITVCTLFIIFSF